MKLCVFGAGAIGGHLAARLAAAGHEVSVVARGANLAGIRERGLSLRSGAEVVHGPVRAGERADGLGVQDAVFVTTKATALGAFAGMAGPLLGRDTRVVFVQNGIPWWYASGLAANRPAPPDLSRLDPGGRLAGAVAPQQVIGGIVYSSNEIVAPGEVHNLTPGRNMLVIGAPDDRESADVARLRDVLEVAGMPSPACADIRAAVWDKLLVNFGSSLCVLLGEPIKALSEDPALAAIRTRLLAEGRAVAHAHGVAVAGAPKRPGGAQVAGATLHKPSMLLDYELGRPMEVEAILAAPLAFARGAGVETPLLEMLVAIAARMAVAKGLYSPP
ncbi:MAG: ketopantoate reductase family protein [Betaproteobacteria bacterium]